MLWEIREIVNGSIWTVNPSDDWAMGKLCDFLDGCRAGRSTEDLKLPNYQITQSLNSYRSFSPSLNMYLMAGL